MLMFFRFSSENLGGSKIIFGCGIQLGWSAPQWDQDGASLAQGRVTVLVGRRPRWRPPPP
jgi:hypothetical protein